MQPESYHQKQQLHAAHHLAVQLTNVLFWSASHDREHFSEKMCNNPSVHYLLNTKQTVSDYSEAN